MIQYIYIDNSTSSTKNIYETSNKSLQAQIENTISRIVEDRRVQATSGTQGYANQGPNNQYGAYDWTVWDGGSYGKMLRAAAHPGDKGFFIEVHDCGRFLSVKASYQSTATGKSVSQNFIVVLKDDNAEANVYMTSTKWRTVSSVSQAASYIQQTIKSLAGYADRK